MADFDQPNPLNPREPSPTLRIRWHQAEAGGSKRNVRERPGMAGDRESEVDRVPGRPGRLMTVGQSRRSDVMPPEHAGESAVNAAGVRRLFGRKIR